MMASGAATKMTRKYMICWMELKFVQPFSAGHSKDAYCSPAEMAFGKTSQLVGTMRAQCPVTNSRTMKIRPLSIQNRSSEVWSQRLMLIFLPPFLGCQTAGGFCWVRTRSPDCRIRAMNRKFR